MIKAFLIALLTSGYITVTQSVNTFETKAECQASIAAGKDATKNQIKRWNKSSYAKYLGTVSNSPPPIQRCLTREQHTQLQAIVAPSNAKIMKEAIAKAKEDMRKSLEAPTKSEPLSKEEKKQLRKMRQDGLEFADASRV